MTLRIWPWSEIARLRDIAAWAECNAAEAWQVADGYLDDNDRLTTDNLKLSEALTATNEEMATLRAQIAKFDGDGDGRIGGSKPNVR